MEEPTPLALAAYTQAVQEYERLARSPGAEWAALWVAASQAAEAADTLAKHYQERANHWYDLVLHLAPKEE